MLLAFVLTTAIAADARPPQIPVREFFKNSERRSYQLSDDGKWIAYLAPYETRMNIFVRPVDSETVVRVSDEKARDIAGFFWKGNDTLVYVKDFGGDENFHLVSVSRDGKTTKDLTPFEKVRAEMVDDLRDFPDFVLVGLNKRKPEVFDVHKINVKTGATEVVAENPGNITGWHTDHTGTVRVAVTTDGVNSSLLYRANAKAPFKPFLTTTFRESVQPQFFTFDNKKLYVSSNLKRDKLALTVMDPATGKEEKPLFEHPDNDVDSLAYSHKRKVMTCAYLTTWKPERKCFDAQSEGIYTELEKQLPSYHVQVESMDKAEAKAVVVARSDRARGTYYLYDVGTKKLTKLGEVAPWLKEADMAEMKPIEYPSRDGLTIHGYLTLPKGAEAKGLPLIVNPHGGPWHRDVWGYNGEVQFLANRGYAVLQMNFRGSTSYGRKFWEASFKEWGGKMQDDVSDGVKYVIGQGIADPKRVCIYGGSYGGYSTLAGLAYSPELYACGVDYVGVSNLFTWMNAFPPYWKPYLEMVHEMVGDPEKDKALLTAKSPALNADKIKAPLFVAQGKNDPRVKLEESDQMVAALKKRGIDVPYLVKDNEGHGFRNEENRFELYEAMEKFLAKYLQAPPPGKAAASAEPVKKK